MEDQGHLPDAPTDDGVDQGSDQDGGEAIRADEVPGSQGSDCGWQSRPGSDLSNEKEYKVPGKYLNLLLELSIRNFNNAQGETSSTISYSQAFWNGYGSAISGLRDFIRKYPVGPEV